MMRIYLSLACLSGGLLFAVCGGTIEMPGLRSQAAGIEQLGSLRFERAVHSSTKLADGRVLIVGGMRVNEEFHDTAEIFEPKTGKFELIPSKMTKKRVSHTATRLKDGRVLIAGGWSNRTAPETSAELFDPKTGRFSAVLPMSESRSGHTATLLENGNVLITGGNDGKRSIDSIEIFEPSEEKFRVIGKLASPRKIHTATLLEDGKVLITGGETKRETVVATAELLDTASGKSYVLDTQMEFKRYKHEAVPLADGRVLIYGGSDPSDFRGQLGTAEVFNPKTRKFMRVGDLNLKRFKVGGSAAVLKDGRVLVAGGAEQAEIFDPKKGQFSLVEGSFDASFFFASATLLDDGRVLIIGGYKYRVRASPLATNGAWIFKN